MPLGNSVQSLVIEKVHWSEAFEELRYFLNPSGPNNEGSSEKCVVFIMHS